MPLPVSILRLQNCTYLSALGKSEAEAAAVLLALNDAALAMKEAQPNG